MMWWRGRFCIGYGKAWRTWPKVRCGGMPVYLIHFAQRYKHAGHYLGYSSDLEGRIRAHRESRGARLLRVVNEAGIAWEVVRVWRDGGYDLEQALKSWRNAPRLCPVCNPLGCGMSEEEQWSENKPEMWDIHAFRAWLGEMRGAVAVGMADETLACPLTSWLAQTYGGQWEVGAAWYRWREGEWLPWLPWCPLPPWAVMFVSQVDAWCGNRFVPVWVALEALEWVLVEVDCRLRTGRGMKKGIWK